MRPLVISTFLALCAGAMSQTWAAIAKQYDRFATAYLANDVNVMLSILSPTYTLEDEAGTKTDYRAYRTQLERRRDQGVVSSAYTVHILSLERKGDTAILGTKEVTKGIGGAEHVHRYRDIWKLEKGVWRLASTTTLGHG